MALQAVLDDRKPEPRAALGARTRAIDAVEALGEARQVLGRDADAGVAHHELRAAGLRAQRIVIVPSAGVYLTAFEIRFDAIE